MKKSSTRKSRTSKLDLRAEAVRLLSANGMQQVQGGLKSNCAGHPCCSCEMGTSSVTKDL